MWVQESYKREFQKTAVYNLSSKQVHFPLTHLEIKNSSEAKCYTAYSISPPQYLAMLLTLLTWDLRSKLGDDRGAVALGCAGAQGEGVSGAWVEACEHVSGLVS